MNNTLENKNDWIGSPDEPLTGFSWKSGSTRDTNGIVMWSDIFLHDHVVDGKEEKIAIVLMDTQGLFDTKTSPADNSRIFALGTLLSSMQIFNLNDVIQEDQLEYLQVRNLKCCDKRYSCFSIPVLVGDKLCKVLGKRMAVGQKVERKALPEPVFPDERLDAHSGLQLRH